jgi:hypothetical protein
VVKAVRQNSGIARPADGRTRVAIGRTAGELDTTRVRVGERVLCWPRLSAMRQHPARAALTRLRTDRNQGHVAARDPARRATSSVQWGLLPARRRTTLIPRVEVRYQQRGLSS